MEIYVDMYGKHMHVVIAGYIVYHESFLNRKMLQLKGLCAVYEAIEETI